MITTTDPGGLVKIVTLTKHENIQTDQQQQQQQLSVAIIAHATSSFVRTA